jgi:predicted ABC-type ATPase
MFTPNQTAILAVFARNKDQAFSMSELGRAIGKSPGVFQRGLNSLENQGFITSRRESNRRLLRLNTAHPLSREITRIAIGAPSPLPMEIYMNFPPATTARIGEPHETYEAAAMKILIIAGPNGAGKTTFARSFLRMEAEKMDFINADYLAHGLSPFSPDAAAWKAGKLMLGELDDHAKRSKSFALETTLSGQRYKTIIPKWQNLGYRIKLIFLSLPSVDIAINRVALRVSQGGHNIPEETIRRRYDAGIDNLENVYKPIVDAWTLYESSGDNPVLIDRGE